MKKARTTAFLPYAHIVFLSLIVLLNIWVSSGLTPVNYPDTETYELPVLEALSGKDISLLVRPVGYPFFIGVVYKIFGAHREFVIYAQQAFGVIAYFLHYLAFRYFIKKEGSAVLAFLVSAGGTLIFYERAVLADFLNYFFLLAALLLFFRYYAKGERARYLALSSVCALIAFLMRPNSLILPALTASFLLFEAVSRQGVRLKWLKRLALYSIVFIASLSASALLTYSVTGHAARPVGVGAPTLLSRVADHIDYGSGPNLEVKDRYKVLRLLHQVDYGKDPLIADASAAYELMTELRCETSPEELDEYRRAAASSEAFYGAHGFGSYYFTVYDVFRSARCGMGKIDAVFMEITKGAVLNDPSGYAWSVITSAWEYIKVRSSDYRGVIGMQSDSAGALSPVLNAFILTGDVFENSIVTGILLLVFIATGAFYFITRDRDRAEYRLAAFLTAYLAANYISIAMLMNVLSPRYKLPVYWVQLILLCLFVGSVLKKVRERRPGGAG